MNSQIRQVGAVTGSQMLQIIKYNLKMSHYNNTSTPAPGSKQPSPELSSFEKSVMNNAKQSIEKHLAHTKIDQAKLNYALFLAIDNFRMDEYADQCLVLLLRHKANPNCQNSTCPFIADSQTPLTAACRKGQQLMVKTLIDFGAKPDLCNRNGESPLAVVLADRRENYDVSQILISHMSSVNAEIGGKNPLVIAVERQFFRIYQQLIQKGANLVYDSQNILHIIVKKKFRKQEKKKKFIKELSGKLFLMQEDAAHKLPVDYEDNQDVRAFILDNFKPKIIRQESIKQDSNRKDKQNGKNKDSETSAKQNKRKGMAKDLDNSFSEIDEEEYQEEKPESGYEPKKLEDVMQIPEEQQIKQKSKMSLQKEMIISPKITRKLTQNSLKDIESNSLILKQQKKQKQMQESLHFQEFKQEQKEKIKKKLNSLTASYKKPSEPAQVVKKKKNNNKNNEDIVPKTLLKRKNNSFDDDSARTDKSKLNANAKKNNKQKQTPQIHERVQKEKVQAEEDKSAQLKRALILCKEFQQVYFGLEEQKYEKQSETDSQQIFQGSLATLNDEIYELVNRITAKNQQKSIHIAAILKLLDQLIRRELQKQRQNPKLQLHVYGSQQTGLYTENSDVDILVESDLQTRELMRILQERGTLQAEGVLQVKFINGATMPIIKLQTSSKYDGISVDIAFQSRGHMGLKCSEMIKAFMVAEPVLRPLVLVIKVLVNAYGLSDPYKGGLGSYAVTLMVIALLQFTQSEKKKPENVGELLINFFYFYGEQLDYISQAVIIHEVGLFAEQPVYSIYRLPYLTDSNPKLIIYDPLNPVNNVGRTTYRIAALKKLFSICYLRLKEDARCRLSDILDGSYGQVLSDY